MGHAHHFLSRLDRVSQDHVELALSLYNDPDLLRAVMAEAHAPESAERIAISLAHPIEGPFLVVTREGRFVTCLGDGMRQSWPVVTRRELDAAIDRISTLRERREISERLCPDERASAKLVERIGTAGENLSREEFVALAAMQPMIWKQLFDSLMRNVTRLQGAYEAFVRIDFRIEHDAVTDLLDAWWHSSWYVRHTLVLLGIDAPRERFEHLPPETLATLRHALTHHAGPEGLMPVVAAGAWATARFGDAFVPICQHRLQRASTRAEVIENAAALFAIAGRSQFYRRAAHRALMTGPSPAANDGPAKALHALKRECEDAFVTTFRRGEDRLEIDAAVAGANLFVARDEAAARRNGWHSVNDMPLALARVALVNEPTLALDERASVVSVLRHLPAIASFRAEDFYLPEALLVKVRRPWSVERTRDLALRLAPPDKRPQRIPAVGRNEECPCGSSRKYKKCCALKDVAPRVAVRLAHAAAKAPEPGVPSLAVTLRRSAA
ncbi:MAG: SEC-C metal-binding domain-containing protein [Polyangiales bacterium]